MSDENLACGTEIANQQPLQLQRASSALPRREGALGMQNHLSDVLYRSDSHGCSVLDVRGELLLCTLLRAQQDSLPSSVVQPRPLRHQLTRYNTTREALATATQAFSLD